MYSYGVLSVMDGQWYYTIVNGNNADHAKEVFFERFSGKTVIDFVKLSATVPANEVFYEIYL